VQIAPAVQMSAPQNAADGGGAEPGGAGDLVGRSQLAAIGEDLRGQFGGSPARTAPGSRGAIEQAGCAPVSIAVHPLHRRLSSNVEAGRGQLQRYSLGHALY
jgi:hypothetical protein